MRTGTTSAHSCRLLSHQQRGTLLVELLMALLLGSVVMLAATRLLVMLRATHLVHQQRIQLEHDSARILDKVEKDLRRAGFCASGCDVPQPYIDTYPGEAAASCLIVYYDLNADGKLDTTENNGESFAYRLRGGALETQRAVKDCRETQWEKITDERNVTVTLFRIESWAGIYRMRLELKRNSGEATVSTARMVSTENLP